MIYFHVSRSLKARIYKNKENNILEFNQYMKPDKMSYSYIIYADIECLIKKIKIFLVNFQNQQTEHLIIKKISSLYRRKDCMKKFPNLEENTQKIQLILEMRESYIYKGSKKKLAKDHWKAKDHCHYTSKYSGATNSICHLKFNVPNEIPPVSHNGSIYYFIIKELTKKFEGKFECLAENTGKYKTFSVPIEKEMNQ